MRRILAAALLATATLAAAPALAQPYGGPGPNPGYGDHGPGYGDRDHGPGYGDRDHDRDHDGGFRPGGDFFAGAPYTPRERVEWLRNKINQGVANGSLDRRQAYRANAELDRVRQTAFQMYRSNGGQFSPRQSAYLQQRLDRVRDMLHYVERRNEGRAY